ncbi:MAG TPA: efflux RND transporter periplasmic adaptor subunit [Polyangiaceae bacterium]|nr:efflux RND transporter periplasmic adaptor subunit [Polyangiaceae bacterium]
MPDQLSSQLASLRIDRTAPARRRGRAWPWVAGIAALGAIGAGFYLFALPRLQSQIFKTAVSFTEVSSVSPAEASVQLTSAGYVVPQRISHVAPKVPGRVLRVHVNQGQAVKPGDLLLTLDSTDDDASLAAARSAVKAAWARVESAKATAATLQAELEEGRLLAERQTRLAKEGVTASGAAEDSAAHVASLKRRAEAAKAEVAAAAADAEARSAETAAMETRMANLVIKSPIAGVVITKPPQEGEVVTPQPAGVTIDMGSVQIADFDTLMVETDVPEQRLQMVKVGTPAEIVLDAFPSRRFRGITAEITPQVNRSKATVVVRVGFVDEKDGVLPDMAARVSFLNKPLDPQAMKEPPKIVVPASALADRAGGKVVFAVEEDVVRMVPVKLGPSFGRGFELIEGPRPGTRLVASPPETMSDGQRIKEKEAQ